MATTPVVMLADNFDLKALIWNQDAAASSIVSGGVNTGWSCVSTPASHNRFQHRLDRRERRYEHWEETTTRRNPSSRQTSEPPLNDAPFGHS
jgi:hypothetical protein